MKKREYNKRAYEKSKKKKEEAASKQKIVMKTLDDMAVDGDCTFGKMVMGFVPSNSITNKECFAVHSKNVRARLCVTTMKWHEHDESKIKGKTFTGKHWRISFYMDLEGRHVSDQPSVTRENIRKATTHKLQPWLEVKQSTLADAGLGLFAMRDFEKNTIVGLYMGSLTQKGNPKHTYAAPFGRVYCHSFDESLSMGERHSVTMGMQMMNDPNWREEVEDEGKNEDDSMDGKDDTVYNVSITGDMIVWATKKIEAGDELFLDYNMTTTESSDEDLGSDSEQEPEDDNNNNGKVQIV
jgi:hypothetical protein